MVHDPFAAFPEDEAPREVPYVAAARHLLGLTIDGLATALNINPRTLRGYESGKYAPGPGVLASIARLIRAHTDGDPAPVPAKGWATAQSARDLGSAWDTSVEIPIDYRPDPTTEHGQLHQTLHILTESLDDGEVLARIPYDNERGDYWILTREGADVIAKALLATVQAAGRDLTPSEATLIESIGDDHA